MTFSLAPLKHVIGCWTCLGTTPVYIEETTARVTVELEVAKKASFQAYIIHYHGPMGFAMWERGKNGSLAAKVKGPQQRKKERREAKEEEEEDN